MMHMMANLIQSPIISMFPESKSKSQGHLEKRLLYNRIIYPENTGRTSPYIAIMWCRGDRDMKSTPNHFVSVVS